MCLYEQDSEERQGSGLKRGTDMQHTTACWRLTRRVHGEHISGRSHSCYDTYCESCCSYSAAV